MTALTPQQKERQRFASVRIESIQAVGRHRRDLGDVAGLARSIAESGQLQPVVLTPDNRLIAGGRRLAALRLLGSEVVEAVYPDNLTDTAAELRAERDENVCRKDMLPSELASLGASLEEIERPRARERMAAAGRSSSPGRPAESSAPEVGPFVGEATQKVADALGISPSTYKRAREVHRAATDPDTPEPERARAQEALSKMDATGQVKPAYDQWKSGEDITPADKPAQGRPVGRRRAFPDLLDGAALSLVKAVERLDRLTTEDRWLTYATKVAPSVRNDLRESLDRLAAVVGRVPNEPTKDGT